MLEITEQASRWWSIAGTGIGELVAAHTETGGASGSAVHRLQVSGVGELILKVAPWGSRSRRELAFYRDLAALVPVLVPRLVASGQHDGSTYLLLSADGSPPRAGEWSGVEWTRVAEELGRLHRAEVASSAGLGVRPRRPVRAERLARARESWNALGYETLLDRLWPSFDGLDEALASLPPCLCHGDCHLGNLLVDGDAIIWIDWQEVGPGSGPEDLALLWQRAEAEGHIPPRDLMLTTYAKTRGIPADETLGRATDAAELRLLLLEWPQYLGYCSPTGRSRLLQRLDELAGAWSA